MKKILINTFILIALTMSISQLNANSSDSKALQAAKETKVEIRERLAKNVSTNKYGDVCIKLPALKTLKSPALKYLPLNLGQLVKYTFPSADLDDMAKVMPAYENASIDLIVRSIDNFLGAKNANLKPTNYSQGSTRINLDNGLPYFAYLVCDEASFGKILARNKDRPKLTIEKKSPKKAKGAKATKETLSKEALEKKPTEEELKKIEEELKNWIKILKKDYQKEFYSSSNTASGSLISGYNKQTREYQVTSANFGTFWILESELKASLLRFYELKF